MRKVIGSFRFALNGLKTAWQEELNFKIEVIVGILVLFCIFYFDFSFSEKVFCIIAITLVLSAEVINTAIEDLCNKIEPNQDPMIGKIKDMSGAFVFLISLGALVIGIMVLINHFF